MGSSERSILSPTSITASGSMKEGEYDESKFRHSNGIEPEYFDGSESGDTEVSLGQQESDAYDIVDAIVSKTDDPLQPVLTFRVIVLGGLFAVVLAVVNTVFSFRSTQFFINPYFTLLVAYPLGNLMYWTTSMRTYTLPYFRWRFTLNPGPFTFKEHCLIFIFARTGSDPSYSLYNVITQKYILGQNISLFWCIVFTLATQLLGYGIAGLGRRFLIRPTAMLWPGVLGTVVTLNSMHNPTDDSQKSSDPNDDTSSIDKKHMSKGTFFWLCGLGMFVYQFLPSYAAPMLGAVSVLCYLPIPYSQTLHLLGSARQGVGMLSLSFDWIVIGQVAPIISPLWASLNQIFGLWLFCWIITPILWFNNAFGADQILGSNRFQGPNGTGQFPLSQALNTATLFNKNGLAISPLLLVNQGNQSVTLNQQAYDANAPIYITTFYAVQIMAIMMVFSSAITHAGLWYGRDIWHRVSNAVADLDDTDIHCQHMDQYNQVPETWYLTIVYTSLLLALSACTWGGFDLPWWGVLLAFSLSLITIIPIGLIEAVSGQRVFTNVEAELLFGFILPGRINALMSFKTLCYTGTNQALNFLGDLKLGHYVKVPPRVMFGVQVVATVVCAVVNVLVAVVVYQWIGVDVMNNNPPVGWNAYGYTLFLSSGAIWGTIGTEKFFGPGSTYFPCLFGFLIGLVAPLIPYFLHALFPRANFNLINFPLIATFYGLIGSTRSDLVTPLIVAVGVNFFAKRYTPGWWSRYAFVMSSAFDMGSGLAVFVTLFVLVVGGKQAKMPFWTLNPVDQDGCAPDYFLICEARRLEGVVIDDGLC
ncbi:hypothetical protein HDU98_009025 [Podochytrium sp. JEL0797]|nr:hypothetical protein HDU98_009025 [Podochytrium sp. JEL0797]